MLLKLDQCYSIADLRRLARRRIPGVMFDYIDGGAEDEVTLGWNRQSFYRYEFIPRVLRNVSEIDLSTRILGQESRLPIICAPTGMSRMFHHEGELAVARAAEQAGIIYSLSTVGTNSIEAMAEAIASPKFFQIYVWKNRELIEDFIQRCRNSNYAALYLAVDLAAFGWRERDLRNGHGGRYEIKIRTALGALLRPLWLWRYLLSPAWEMANMRSHLPKGGDLFEALERVNEQFDASVDWEDACWIRELWGGPFILKGIQCVEDAERAVEMGADAIVLSNHGGRQLDGAPAALDLLPEVVEAVGDCLDVIIDGGIRRGSDVIKAIALGAKACLIGRPYLYGLAAGGQAGVTKSLTLLEAEMERTMKLIGCPSLAQLDASYIRKHM